MTATGCAESTSLGESHLPLAICISNVRKRLSLHLSNPARSECVEPGTVASYLLLGLYPGNELLIASSVTPGKTFNRSTIFLHLIPCSSGFSSPRRGDQVATKSKFLALNPRSMCVSS